MCINIVQLAYRLTFTNLFHRGSIMYRANGEVSLQLYCKQDTTETVTPFKPHPAANLLQSVTAIARYLVLVEALEVVGGEVPVPCHPSRAPGSCRLAGDEVTES